MVQQAAVEAVTAAQVVDTLLQTSLVVSPPANDGSALVLVDTDIGGAHKLVANVRSSSADGKDANAHNRVGAHIGQPDGLVLDGIDSSTGVHAAASAKRGGKRRMKVRFRFSKTKSPSSRIFRFASGKRRRRRSIACMICFTLIQASNQPGLFLNQHRFRTFNLPREGGGGAGEGVHDVKKNWKKCM